MLHLVPADTSPEVTDPESDIGFFTMSPASAEQVTIQIRAVLDRAWEYIALAYKGRAHIALGHRSWDEYVDTRFGDLRLAVPREHRSEIVTTLAGARMSIRAIAKLLGVGVGTVHRELARTHPDNPNRSDDSGDLPPVLGRDGKTYSRTRRSADILCSTCGESHPTGTVDCPWDLYAQGIGPSPTPDETDPRALALDNDRPDDDHYDRPIEIADERTACKPTESEVDAPEERADNRGASVDELRTRIDALLTDLRNLTDLVTRIDSMAAAKTLSESGRDDHILAKIRSTAEVAVRETASWMAVIDFLHEPS